MSRVKAFINGRVSLHGKELSESVYVDEDTGMIIRQPAEMPSKFVDLEGRLLAPAFLELQTNGCLGFHFTDFRGAENYKKNLDRVSKHLVSRGVGAFWVTLPTVDAEVFKKILPNVRPREVFGGADLLGAHCEGPFLNPAKKGAHDAALMQRPSETSLEDIYGDAGQSAIKLLTIAPELLGSTSLIQTLSHHRSLVISLGHSLADYDTGLHALEAGAKCLTHVFNAMPPLHHRSPGLAGLITSVQAPFFSMIADGIHLHPATLVMAYRSNPERCILITDSIEMAGMPDGLYPGQVLSGAPCIRGAMLNRMKLPRHAQVPHVQRKHGNKITIEGTETLIGSSSSIDECVRNLKRWSGCSMAKAVRCASENIAELMGLTDRGVVEPGRRADFVVLDDEGMVLQTWISGSKVFDAKH